METPKLLRTMASKIRTHSRKQVVINLSSLMHASHLIFHERHREVTKELSTVAGQILLGNAWRLQARGGSQEQLPNRFACTVD